MTEVGYASLGIIPDFDGFQARLEAGTSKAMLVSGRSGGTYFGDAAGRSAGRSFSSRFGSIVRGAGLFGAAGLGYGLTSFVKDSVNLEAEFSRTMSQMREATQAPADELERMRDLAVKLGKDTIFSANDASGAMLELAKNGIKPATIEAGALESALTLAAAGGTELDESASAIGNALNAFRLRGKDAASVAAALAGAANASSASVQSLQEGLQQSSAVAADTGMSVQETTAALAAFANAGLAGSDAGTSFKTFLSRLVPQSKIAGKAFEIMNLGFTKSNGEFKSLAAIADELRDKFGDMSAEERAVALNTTFGSDARRAATILMREGADGVREYIDATSDQQAADRMAKANMEGTAGAIEKLKGAWETTKLEFGESIAPVASDFLIFLSDKLDDLSPKLAAFGDWFSDDAVPAIKDFADDARPLVEKLLPAMGDSLDIAADALEKAVPFAEDLVDAFNGMPDWAKKAVLAGGALYVGGKVLGGGGGGGGVSGVPGSATVGAFKGGFVSRAGEMAADRLLARFQKPIPVIVTNPGFGAASGVPGAGGKGAPPVVGGGPTGGVGVLGGLAFLGAGSQPDMLPIGYDQNGNEIKEEDIWTGDNARAKFNEIVASGEQSTKELHALFADLRASFGDDFDYMGWKGRRTLDRLQGDFAKLPETLRTALVIEGGPDSMREVKALQALYDLTPKEVKTLVKVYGVDEAKRQVEVALTPFMVGRTPAKESQGADSMLPAPSDVPSRTSGRRGSHVTINQNIGTVNDSKTLDKQNAAKAQQAAMGGW